MNQVITRPAPPPASRSQARSGRRPLYLLLLLLLALGLGGGLFGLAVGGSPGAVDVPQPANPSPPRVAGPTAPVAASNAQLMGLTTVTNQAAADFTLSDQHGRAVSLSALDRHDAVVIAFMDDRCQQACPVITRELVSAERLLGANAGRVQLVAVDLDLGAGAPTRVASYLAGPGRALASSPDFHFLTGPAATVRSVWRHYGIQVGTSPTGILYHNEAMWFVAPGGQLRYQATPYANERPDGTWWLPASTTQQWARGIAQYASASLTP
jgi:cytochrome oxidase Cu insertion factor (SCO1/SenC/PrrC family)